MSGTVEFVEAVEAVSTQTKLFPEAFFPSRHSGTLDVPSSVGNALGNASVKHVSSFGCAADKPTDEKALLAVFRKSIPRASDFCERYSPDEETRRVILPNVALAASCFPTGTAYANEIHSWKIS